MKKTFEYFLNKVKLEKINEGEMHWMVGTIPSPTEWEKVLLSSVIGHETYKLKLVDKFYVIPESKLDWFKDNVGKTIKFKYDKESREIMQVEIVNTNPPVPNENNPTNIANESLMASDVKNVLLKYTNYLIQQNLLSYKPSESETDTIINTFIG
jgi:hypothetical protein